MSEKIGYEEIDGIHIYRHSLPPEHSSALGYLRDADPKQK